MGSGRPRRPGQIDLILQLEQALRQCPLLAQGRGAREHLSRRVQLRFGGAKAGVNLGQVTRV